MELTSTLGILHINLCLQRLKAAIHYGVGKICQESEAESEVQFTKQFTAVLAEAAFKQCEKMATDLELFARLVFMQYLSIHHYYYMYHFG